MVVLGISIGVGEWRGSGVWRLREIGRSFGGSWLRMDADFGVGRVRGFLREAVMFVAGIVKRELRVERKRLWKARSLESFGIISGDGILEGYSEDFETRTECSALATTLEKKQRTSASLGHSHRLNALNTERSKLKAIPQEAAQEAHESKNKRPEFSVVIGINTKPEALAKKLRYSDPKHPETPGKLTHQPLGQIPPDSTEKVSAVTIERTVRAQRILETKPKATSPATDTPPVTAETGSRHTVVFSASNTTFSSSECSDFVLETCLGESPEIKLVYGANLLSLPNLIDKIRERHHLKHDQEILEMKIAIGDKIFDVNLKEPRDWKYISKDIADNGSRAQVLVSIS